MGRRGRRVRAGRPVVLPDPDPFELSGRAGQRFGDDLVAVDRDALQGRIAVHELLDIEIQVPMIEVIDDAVGDDFIEGDGVEIGLLNGDSGVDLQFVVVSVSVGTGAFAEPLIVLLVGEPRKFPSEDPRRDRGPCPEELVKSVGRVEPWADALLFVRPERREA